MKKASEKVAKVLKSQERAVFPFLLQIAKGTARFPDVCESRTVVYSVTRERLQMMCLDSELKYQQVTVASSIDLLERVPDE